MRLTHAGTRSDAILSTLLLVGCAATAGCEVTSEKIQQWKRTERGPSKLQEAVRDSALDKSLRVEAARALVELTRVDALAGDLKALKDGDADGVRQALARSLAEQMRGSKPEATSKKQLAAKDALFGLRDALGKQPDGELAQWILADYGARQHGVHGGEKIIRALGPVAGPILAKALVHDERVVVPLTMLLRAVGTQADREVGATALVALASGASNSGTAVPDERVLEALGRLGQPATRAFLMKRTRTGSQSQRLKAYLALKYDRSKALVGPMGRVAQSQKQPLSLRSAAIEVLETIRLPTEDGPASVLGKIVSRDPNEQVRFRCVEALITCCGTKGAAKALESLPTRQKYSEQDVVDLIEADLKKLGKAVVPVLRNGVKSKSWIARTVAVRLLGQLGGGVEDQSAVQSLVADRTPLRGWGRAATVGSEAQASAALLKKKP